MARFAGRPVVTLVFVALVVALVALVAFVVALVALVRVPFVSLVPGMTLVMDLRCLGLGEDHHRASLDGTDQPVDQRTASLPPCRP